MKMFTRVLFVAIVLFNLSGCATTDSKNTPDINAMNASQRTMPTGGADAAAAAARTY